MIIELRHYKTRETLRRIPVLGATTRLYRHLLAMEGAKGIAADENDIQVVERGDDDGIIDIFELNPYR